MNNTVNILGTEYKLEYKTEEQDEMFNSCNGYCDYTGKRIVVLSKARKNDDCDDFEVERMRIVRHEIVHCFLIESGLIGNTHRDDNGWAKNEEMVDWIAIQFPKMCKVFKELGVL